MSILLTKIHVGPTAKDPAYGSAGAGAFDIHADFKDNESREVRVVSKDCPAIVPTGLYFEIPKGYTLLVVGRSGHGFKFDVRLANCVGVIDSDYRGELLLKISCDAHEKSLEIKHGMAIAQGLIVATPKVVFEKVPLEDLSKTERGSGGFGSTDSAKKQ